MDINTALDKLFSLHQFGIKLGLENISNLLDHIGNPHKDLKSFHVAGSNGKGSTVSFMASILVEAGFKVGLFTSPHLVKFNERIRINGKMIPDDYVRDFMNELDDYIDKNEPTFFELTTAMAFKYFAENKVDYAVVETGLGGRLDATNVLNPIACVITSISHEHSSILGDTLEKIASEKAGIFKTGSKIFLADMPEEVLSVFQNRANELKCEVFRIKDYTDFGKDYLQLNINDDHKITLYQTPLRGRCQLRNSSLAAFVLGNSLANVDATDMLYGISRVINNTGIAGRYEVYSEQPKIIFDAAHNSEGIESFVEEFRNEFNNYDKCSLIFGMMQDKNISDALNKLGGFFDDIYATTIEYGRAAKIEDILEEGKKVGITLMSLPEPAKFINDFQKLRRNECLVILGSIYIIGKIKSDLVRN